MVPDVQKCGRTDGRAEGWTDRRCQIYIRPILSGDKKNKIDLLVEGVCNTASNLGLLLQKEQNVKGGEGPSGKQAVGINNGTR